jgi:hypothetical protein
VAGIRSRSAVTAAFDAILAGTDVDFGQVRAVIAHEFDQYHALALEMSEPGPRGLQDPDVRTSAAAAAKHMANLVRRLGPAVDRLEEGDVDGARAAVRAALLEPGAKSDR